MYLDLMSAGRALIAGSLNSSNKPKITSFDIGTSFGFVPDRNATRVRPGVIYSGGVDAIRKTVVSDNEVIFHVVLPNDLELSAVGNIMLRTDTGAPFLWFVLRSSFAKSKVNGEKHFGGDLQFQSMVLKIPQIVDRLDLSVNPDFYSIPANYGTVAALPPPVSSPTSEAIIQNSDHLFNADRPIHAFRIGDSWYGVPQMKPLDDEYFGVRDGGVVGDGYGGY